MIRYKKTGLNITNDNNQELETRTKRELDFSSI